LNSCQEGSPGCCCHHGGCQFYDPAVFQCCGHVACEVASQRCDWPMGARFGQCVVSTATFTATSTAASTTLNNAVDTTAATATRMSSTLNSCQEGSPGCCCHHGGCRLYDPAVFQCCGHVLCDLPLQKCEWNQGSRFGICVNLKDAATPDGKLRGSGPVNSNTMNQSIFEMSKTSPAQPTCWFCILLYTILALS
jgi:hypothetical protein